MSTRLKVNIRKNDETLKLCSYELIDMGYEVVCHLGGDTIRSRLILRCCKSNVSLLDGYMAEPIRSTVEYLRFLRVLNAYKLVYEIRRKVRNGQIDCIHVYALLCDM